MNKPEVCEWDDCQKKNPNHVVVLDGEKYYFCSDEHAEEFFESIRENY